MKKEYLVKSINSDSVRWADQLQSELDSKMNDGWELFSVIGVRMSHDEKRISHDCIFVRERRNPEYKPSVV